MKKICFIVIAVMITHGMSSYAQTVQDATEYSQHKYICGTRNG